MKRFLDTILSNPQSHRARPTGAAADPANPANWSGEFVDSFSDGTDSTNKEVAFGALQPKLDVHSDSKVVVATLKRNALHGWAAPKDLLLEIQKSYPDCTFDNEESPTAIIFSGASADQFKANFDKWLSTKTRPREPF